MPALDPTTLPCDRITSLEVTKSTRTLVARCEGGGERRFTIALSRARSGPKRVRGDHRMPEGEYRVAGVPRASRFHRFVPIDYPSLADAELALAEGRIDRATHARIARAHEHGHMPPQDTPLGGLLGLHGEGRRWRGDSLHLDWTDGCVAMSDEWIDFVAERAPRGTPVRIAP